MLCYSEHERAVQAGALAATLSGKRMLILGVECTPLSCNSAKSQFNFAEPELAEPHR